MFKKPFALTLAAVVLSVAALAARPSNPAVTATVFDTDTAGAQVLLRSDDYNGSGQASYSSVINLGVWQMGTGTTRAVWITPNDPIDSTQPQAPPAGFYSQNVTVRSHCFDASGNIVPLQNVVTSSSTCHLGVNFNSGGVGYKLLMSPFPLSGAGDFPPTCPSTGCPAPGWATVTCNAVADSQCVDWTIVPNTTIANAEVANLYQLVSTKRSSTWLYIGQYHNSFRIHVTNP